MIPTAKPALKIPAIAEQPLKQTNTSMDKIKEAFFIIAKI
jgi:hypothetical protein